MSEPPEVKQEPEGSGLSLETTAPPQTTAAPPRRTEIRAEYHQLFIIRKPEGLTEVWCAACEARVNMVITEAAAVLANTDTRTIYRRIESGAIHFTETTEGLVLVCLNSLIG